MTTEVARGKPRIVVLDDWEQALGRLADWSAVSALADVRIHTAPLAGDALGQEIAGADVLVLNRDRTPLDAPLIAQAPRLKFVVYTGPRNRRIDFAALQDRGIPVSCTEGGPAVDSTSEHTWSLILALARQLRPWMATMAEGAWRPDAPAPLPSVLRGERLGLLGCGNVGGQVGAVALAFGMEVVTWSPHMTQERAARHGARAVSLEELLGTSRFVSVHLVAAPELSKLLDAPRLRSMRRDSLLVNTSRAELVDTDALVAALQERTIAGAALDVYPHEPLAADHPLRALDNVVLTPHIGFLNEATCAVFAQGVVQALGAWLAGTPLPNPVLPHKNLP